MQIRSILFLFILSFPILLNAQNNLQLRSVLQYSDRCSDVWAYVDSSGNEYALVGERNGVSIVNVTDPDSIFELFYIPGPPSIWRDLKTWNGFAYITNETRGGLRIIDLNDLPNSIDTARYNIAPTDTWQSAHNLYIEDGYAYIFGANLKNRGAIIYNLSDPWKPSLAGFYDLRYVHDGFVRNDTLWVAEINEGTVSAVDVSDKMNPVLIGRTNTPFNFAHNVWLSDNGHILYTTDEKNGAPVASYDVSDISNFIELDQLTSNGQFGVIPHNVTVVGDHLMVSYYKDGVIMVDASDPSNMIITGNYDTSPLPPSGGTQGCWGIYPYLPSGNVLATDISEGLFVLTPTYTKAAYLHGIVTNAQTAFALPGVSIEVMGTGNFETTDLFGQFRTGAAASGLYDLRLTADNCPSLIIPGIQLTQGDTTYVQIPYDCVIIPTGTSTIESSDDILQLRNGPSGSMLYYNVHSNSQIVISDLQGKQLYSINLTSGSGYLNVTNILQQGHYIATLSTAKGFESIPFTH